MRATCDSCHGHGQVIHRQGFFTLSQTCGACAGAGTVAKDPCHSCGGEGRRREVRHLNIKIPAGVDTGTRLRVSGEGEGGLQGGRGGDLFVVVHVKEHPLFRRDGPNLMVELPVTLPQAVLGTEAQVPTLESSSRLAIPPGTQHGTVQRLRGEGPAKLSGKGRGDIHYRLTIDVPRSLNREQKKAVDDLASVMNGNPRERLFGERR